MVHLNGYVEEFDPPTTVGQVTGKPALHFVCTAAQLLSVGSKPLKPEAQLEAGHVYFLLPISAFHSDASPVDMAGMVGKLTAIARTTPFTGKSSGSKTAPPPPSSSPAGSQFMGVELMADGMKGSSKGRTWKPILATIRERSFNRRSESDLQKECSES